MTTTKRCPKCGNERLGQIPSQKLKFCPDCDTWIDWSLDVGQKPLVGPSRHMRKG